MSYKIVDEKDFLDAIEKGSWGRAKICWHFCHSRTSISQYCMRCTLSLIPGKNTIENPSRKVSIYDLSMLQKGNETVQSCLTGCFMNIYTPQMHICLCDFLLRDASTPIDNDDISQNYHCISYHIIINPHPTLCTHISGIRAEAHPILLNFG